MDGCLYLFFDLYVGEKMKKQSSYKWIKNLGINPDTILDPDGWDRHRLKYSMSRAIKYSTFIERLSASTVLFDHVNRKLFEKYDYKIKKLEICRRSIQKYHH